MVTRLRYVDIIIYVIPGSWIMWTTWFLLSRVDIHLDLSTGNQYVDGGLLVVLAFVVGQLLDIRADKSLLLKQLAQRVWGKHSPELSLILGRSNSRVRSLLGRLPPSAEAVLSFAQNHLGYEAAEIKVLSEGDEESEEAVQLANKLLIDMALFLAQEGLIDKLDEMYDTARFYKVMATSTLYSAMVATFAGALAAKGLEWSSTDWSASLLQLLPVALVAIVSLVASIVLAFQKTGAEVANAAVLMSQVVLYDRRTHTSKPNRS